MAKTLEKETVAAIEQAIFTAQRAGRQADLHAIAAVFNCTYQSVCYIRRRIEKHQRTGIDDRKKAGRKPIPDHDRMAQSLRELLQRRPGLDQSALSDFLYDEYGKRVCQATISRMLKKNAIPHKISNKLYKKSRLVTTSKRGSEEVSEDISRELAASALSELPAAPYEIYRSSYIPTTGPSNDLLNSVTGHFNESLAEASSGTDFGSHITEENMATYSSPYL